MSLIKQFCYIVAYRLYRLWASLYQKISGKIMKQKGVKCFIECNGKILMVRNTYANPEIWTFPGGRVQEGETLEEAVRREIKEEVGITLGEVIKLEKYPATKKIVHYFYSRVPSTKTAIDNAEIAEAAWFSPRQIPNPSVLKKLKKYEYRHKKRLLH
jgi:ADP-ribose pyrophosphatase YjhB (NUDIX family)